MNRKVDFICIGAERSGTTWLFDHLSKHPDIYMPKQKGLHYFDPIRGRTKKFVGDNGNYHKPIEWYHSFFESAKDNQILGECTPNYLSREVTAQDIWEYNPNIKIIAILRNPVERAFSVYLYWKQRGMLRDISFRKTIETEPMILEYGKYAKILRCYFDLFPSEQLCIMFFEDMIRNYDDFYKKMLLFLEVDATLMVNNLQVPSNESKKTFIPYLNHFLYSIRYKIVHTDRLISDQKITPVINFIDKILKANVVKHSQVPTIRKSDREYLEKYFENDIFDLESLLNKNLDIWRNPTKY